MPGKQDNTTPKPSTGSSARDFDFLQGLWKIRNRKLKTRFTNADDWYEFDATGEMRTILHGLGNTDSFLATPEGRPLEAITLRLFNPVTRLWSIYWADSAHGTLDPPVIGSFANNMGMFTGSDTMNGKDILLKFNWDKSDPSNPVWSQAFSEDDGKSWEWNWYMYFSKQS